MVLDKLRRNRKQDAVYRRARLTPADEERIFVATLSRRAAFISTSSTGFRVRLIAGRSTISVARRGYAKDGERAGAGVGHGGRGPDGGIRADERDRRRGERHERSRDARRHR